MIPRGILDISVYDLLLAMGTCLLPTRPTTAESTVLTAWDTSNSIVSLSVRSGFDLLLQGLQLPTGSEILVSAITIPDMIHILEHHGLVAVPVDLEPATMGIDLAAMRRALTPNTKAILVAHLFGSRIDLDPISAFADQHGLFLWEDCAQAYAGPGFRGHRASDVVMFSFGTIKTHTALGGAILIVRNEEVRTKMAAIQAEYPIQSRWGYLKRVVRLSALLTLAPPPIFALVVALLRWVGINHDDLFSKVVRGFPGADLFSKIRHRPCAPLLIVLERRLRHADPHSIDQRIALAERIFATLPGITRPAVDAPIHTHWVVPIFSRNPDELIRRLWQVGFDATRRASSMNVVQSSQATRYLLPTPNAQQILDQMLYLPIYPYIHDEQIKRMGQMIVKFETEQGTVLYQSSQVVS